MVSACVLSAIRLGSYRVTDSLQVRQFNNIDLDSLRYTKFDGMHQLEPAVDLSGEEIDSKTGEPPISASI
jgi:hypothetical protein